MLLSMKRSFAIFFVCFFQLSLFTFHVNAQWYDPSKVDRHVGDIYGQALQLVENEKYTQAIEQLDKTISLDPKMVDAYLTRAGVNRELKNYTAAVADFETAFKLDSVYANEFYLPYSEALAGDGK